MAARVEIASSPAPAAATPGAALPLRSGVRLRALVLIRWAAVAGQLFTAAAVHWGLGVDLPVLAVGGAIALSALLNLTVSLGRPASARIDDREATVFLAFDILQLAVLLYLTGGLVNPFVLLLLAPVAIGATILSLASNVALSLLTIASIALLGIFHQPLPWRGPPPALPEVYRARGSACRGGRVPRRGAPSVPAFPPASSPARWAGARPPRRRSRCAARRSCRE